MTPTLTPISEITVLDRQRIDLGDIDSLAKSLATHGLIQPIVINHDKRLIAGGRRLTAAQSLGWTEIPTVFKEALTEEDLTMMELEENIQRKEMTWKERALSVYKVHLLQSKKAIIERNENWTMEMTGQMLNMSIANTSYLTQVARELKDPNSGIHQCEGLTEAIRWLADRAKDLIEAKLAERTKNRMSLNAATMQEAKLSPTEIDEIRAKVQSDEDDDTPGSATPTIVPLSQMLLLGKAEDILPTLPPNHVDHIISDPPYAIDMQMLNQDKIERTEKEHDVNQNLMDLTLIIPELYRVLKPGGFCALWCDQMRWQFLYEELIATGFRVQRWPITWVKTSQCANQAASYNFTKNTEICIIASKGNATLAKTSPTCVISAQACRGESNPFAKPPEVWNFLIDHLTHPHQLVLDPFCGEGSIIKPLLGSWRTFLAIEMNELHHNVALNRTKEFMDILYRKPTYT